MEERFESVAQAVLAAVNGADMLKEGERVAFASLDETGGLAIFPREGETVEEEHRSVTGRVRRVCLWPFALVCRAGGPAERQRQNIAAWMDGLGRSLEKGKYPALTDGRRLLSIQRAGVPRQGDRPADRTETWVMDMTARYETITNLIQEEIG